MKKTELFLNAPAPLIELASQVTIEWARTNARHYAWSTETVTFGTAAATVFNECLNGMISEGPIDPASHTLGSILSEAEQKIERILQDQAAQTSAQAGRAGG